MVQGFILEKGYMFGKMKKTKKAKKREDEENKKDELHMVRSVNH